MDRSIWWHYAVLVIPRETRIPDAAMALVVGWNNKATNDPNSVLDRTGNCHPFVTTPRFRLTVENFVARQ